jgi:hypothetical protein
MTDILTQPWVLARGTYADMNRSEIPYIGIETTSGDEVFSVINSWALYETIFESIVRDHNNSLGETPRDENLQ